jgi:prepilin-type N-terminal cleavage/methylation domain-containing protein/prepilin-type processing-associated H-X9-DG protein
MKQEKSFTLIELLVVVAVIAVLIAMLLPALQKARELSQQAVCASHWRQIGIYMQMYQQDYRDKMPPTSFNLNLMPFYDNQGDSRYDGYCGFGMLKPYITSKTQLGNSGDWLDLPPAGWVSTEIWDRGIFGCPVSNRIGFGNWLNILYTFPVTAEGSRPCWEPSIPWPFAPPDPGQPSNIAVGVCSVWRTSSMWVPQPFHVDGPYEMGDGKGVNILRWDGHVLWRKVEDFAYFGVNYGADGHGKYRAAFNN